MEPRSRFGDINSKEIKKAVDKMAKEKLTEFEITIEGGKNKIIRLQDSKAGYHYFIQQDQLSEARPIFNGKKIDIATGKLSEEKYIIKKAPPTASTSEHHDARKEEIAALRKLYSTSVFTAATPCAQDPDEDDIYIATKWLGVPLQTLKENKDKGDYFQMNEAVAKLPFTDKLDIIQQVLSQLNTLHKAGKGEGKDGEARLWGDPKGENILIQLEEGKPPKVSLIDMGGSHPVLGSSLIQGTDIETSPWHFVSEKLGKPAKQGVLSDFPPLVAVFAQLLGEDDVLKNKRIAVLDYHKSRPSRSGDISPTAQQQELNEKYSFEDVSDSLPDELKAPITRFLNWMQEKEYTDRPSRDMPLAFFSAVHDYCHTSDPEKKLSYLTEINILSSETLRRQAHALMIIRETWGEPYNPQLLAFLSDDNETSREAAKLLIKAAPNKSLLENILYSFDIITNGKVTGASLTLSAHPLTKEILSSGELTIHARNFLNEISEKKSSKPPHPKMSPILNLTHQYSAETIDEKKMIHLEKLVRLAEPSALQSMSLFRSPFLDEDRPSAGPAKTPNKLE